MHKQSIDSLKDQLSVSKLGFKSFWYDSFSKSRETMLREELRESYANQLMVPLANTPSALMEP